MRFSEKIKKITLKPICHEVIDINKIKCQYNTDRCKYWIKVCGDSFSINSSPFWEYLNSKNTQKYFDLFRLYGRSDVWISNNILKFQTIFNDIMNNGYNDSKGLPVVLEKPIVKNKYNSGYEIYEGHRRLTICKYLNIKQRIILCRYQII